MNHIKKDVSVRMVKIVADLFHILVIIAFLFFLFIIDTGSFLIVFGHGFRLSLIGFRIVVAAGIAALFVLGVVVGGDDLKTK